jgi:acetolactate synthase regulatory subunit
MTTTTALSPLPQAGLVSCTLTLELCPSADVVVRVLMMLRRRGCTITSIDYAVGDHHFAGRLRIGLRAPARRAHCVEHWVANLVDVVAVSVDVAQ